MCLQPPWNLSIVDPRFTKYVSSYNARLLRYDAKTMKATFQVQITCTWMC